MFKLLSAIPIGIAAGYALCFPANALKNEAVLKFCESRTETHRILNWDQGFGPSYNCISKDHPLY